MNDGPTASLEATGRERWEARRAHMVAVYDQACRRQEELVALSKQTRVRRAQIREERERVRAQMALRRTLVLTPDRRAAAVILEAAWQVTGISLEELWLDYFALGGEAGPERLRAMISGEVPVGRADHDRLAVALNERLVQAGWGRPLAYWDGSR